MKKGVAVIIITAMACIYLSGCGIVRQVLNRNTAATKSLALTASTPGESAAPTQDGGMSERVEYRTDKFTISLPERWKAVDIEKDGYDAVPKLVAQYDKEWAKRFTKNPGAEVFWAMDPEIVGNTRVTFSISMLTTSYDIASICDTMEAAFENDGSEIIENKQDLTINGLPAGRLELTSEEPKFTNHGYQYFISSPDATWSFAVQTNDTQWDYYEPIFDSIADSFKLN